jgi:hypothetical protein
MESSKDELFIISYYWEPRKANLADYFTEYYPSSHHRRKKKKKKSEVQPIDIYKILDSFAAMLFWFTCPANK